MDGSVELPQALKVNTAFGANFVVGVGDVCYFAKHFLVLVSSLVWIGASVVASCNICVLKRETIKDIIMDSELICPTSRLFIAGKVKDSSAMSKRVKDIVRDGMELTKQ